MMRSANIQSKWLAAGFFLLTSMLSSRAFAEVSELKIAQQYGISYLPLMIAVDHHLIEKYAKEAGVPNLKVAYSKVAGSNVMNDALLSGSLHIASGGVTGLVTLWAKTKGVMDVRGISAISAMPNYLLTRNPKVKTVKDFTSTDKIALPSAKVGPQAIALQMASAKAFGIKNYDQLDKLTVSMSHADGMQALLSGASDVDAHFTSPPYTYREIHQPGIHKVLSSYDVAGTNSSFVLVWTTDKFRKENPKVYGVVFKALGESIDYINKNKKAAATDYLRISKEKFTQDEIYSMLTDPENQFTMTPKDVMNYVSFMEHVGTIKVKASSWKDLFFPEIYKLPGS